MCQPKFWHKIYAEETKEDRHKSIISIIAERSDLEIFNLQIELEENDSLSNVASKVKKAIDSLESYRDCDCSLKAGTCLKHMNLIKIPQLRGPNSIITIGRRG